MIEIPEFDLVIFDCDGVLIDSETLSARVLMSLLREHGVKLSFEAFVRDFLGRGFGSAVERLQQHTGVVLPDDLQDEYLTRLLRSFERELKPMEGIEAVLDRLSVQSCVASSSAPRRLNFALELCGLLNRFSPHVFSASAVANGKPAPDLFLHVAATMNVAPSRCLVIEDTELGVLAARAAGMAVWQYAGGSHVKAGYALPPHVRADRVLATMEQLHAAFAGSGLSAS